MGNTESRGGSGEKKKKSSSKGEKYFDVTVEVKIVMTGNDQIMDPRDEESKRVPIPTKTKLDKAIYAKLLKNAREKSTKEGIIFTLQTGYPQSSCEILSGPVVFEENGRIGWKLRARWIFCSKTTVRQLRKRVEEVAEHFTRSGDLGYKVQMFKLIRGANIGPYETKGKMYHYRY